MLVARVCQFYPNAAAATLVDRFFWVFSEWVWPKMSTTSNGLPVILKSFPDEQLPYGFPVWDPRVTTPATSQKQLQRNVSLVLLILILSSFVVPFSHQVNQMDKFHLMPIITPAYPQQNSAYNVTTSTRSIIIIEIKRAFNICKRISEGALEWDALFEPENFFSRYKYIFKFTNFEKLYIHIEFKCFHDLTYRVERHFLVLIVSTPVKEQYMDWVRLVESKIRFLIQVLEKNQYINLVHVNPQGYEDLKDTYVWHCFCTFNF